MTAIRPGELYRANLAGNRTLYVRAIRKSVTSPTSWECEEVATGRQLLLGEDVLAWLPSRPPPAPSPPKEDAK